MYRRNPLPFLLSIASLVTITSCSVYRSDGRKFLESGLSTVGVSVQSNWIGCDRLPDVVPGMWEAFESTEQVNVLKGEGELFDMRVIPWRDSDFHCDYRFTSAEEMYKKTEAAIAHTLEQFQPSALKSRGESESTL
jgi:hypothetical protein